MAEPTKLLEPANGHAPTAPARKNTPKIKYALPIPIRTFPLPSFYPSNPASLLHLAVAWALQIVRPPPPAPDVVHCGIWSAATRSVHVTDPTSMNDLWCQGFFGKGSLSRSEPSWLRRQLGETSEQRTAKRREERASSKWERGRTELEALERKRRDEEQRLQSFEHSVPPERPVARLGAKTVQWKAPVGPLELLALPNSQAELVAAEQGQPVFCAPVGPRELLALPNSQADLDRCRKAAALSSEQCVDAVPLPETPSCQDTPTETSWANMPNTPNGTATPYDECHKRKSVRFSPTVESTTFQHSDPPRPSRRPNGGKAVAEATVPISATAEPPPTNKEHLQLAPEEAFFLAYGLGALVVTDEQNGAPLTTAELFVRCRQSAWGPPRDAAAALPAADPFVVHYAVYHHFRALGWVPRHGVKFGVDWLLYGKGPALDHAEFGVLVMPSSGRGGEPAMLSWRWLHSVNRVLSTVFKSLVLVYVEVPAVAAGADVSPSALLSQCRIREVMVRRWSSNRNR